MLCVPIRIASMRRFLMSTYNVHVLLFWRKLKSWPYNAFWPGFIINPHWLELPMSRTNFHSPKGVRAIKVRLYFHTRCYTSVFFLVFIHRHFLSIGNHGYRAVNVCLHTNVVEGVMTEEPLPYHHYTALLVGNYSRTVKSSSYKVKKEKANTVQCYRRCYRFFVSLYFQKWKYLNLQTA